MTTTSALLVATVLLGVCAAGTMAYPSLWAGMAPSCTAIPTKGYDCHKAPVADKNTVVAVTDAAGKPVTKICAGKPYKIRVSYTDGSKRLAYITTSGGAVATKTTTNTRCANSIAFDRGHPTSKTPASSQEVVAVAPPKAGDWTISVASATGGCAPYLTAVATAKVTC